MFLERILNDHEKIKRAEEIYYRRNNRNIAMGNRGIEPRRQKTYLGSKILLEMLILVILAVTVFAVKNRDYIFTQNFLQSISKYNINLTEKFDFIMAYLKEDDENEGEGIFVNNQPAEENQPVIENTEEPQSLAPEEQAPAPVQETSNPFIKPIEGVVTSGFGARESVYQNVTGNHTGVDIGADAGTHIKASMTGVVSQVSREGDYGNHIRITKDNVTTLYAHCQDIFVEEGQEITQGQVIATVGSTGNSTGPHLHFEIRVDDTPINPAEKIDF